MSGLKRKDIVKCAGCGQGVMRGGAFHTFYRVKVERHMVDTEAVRRLAGLEMMITPILAGVMGPDEDLTRQLGDTITFLLCEMCMTNTTLETAVRNSGAWASAEKEDGE